MSSREIFTNAWWSSEPVSVVSDTLKYPPADNLILFPYSQETLLAFLGFFVERGLSAECASLAGGVAAPSAFPVPPSLPAY